MIENTDIKTILPGGREGKIYKVGDVVTRPSNPWTPTIHAYLAHLHAHDVDFVPMPISIDEKSNIEQVSYLKGDVCNYPLNAAFKSETVLISAAKLLHQLHDASTSFLAGLGGDEQWMLPVLQPAEVICHADYAPYNVVVQNFETVGIIDFDTCHPGTRVWDVAYAIYRWAPLNRPDADDVFVSFEQRVERAKQFCNAYGLNAASRQQIMPVMIERLKKMIDYITTQANDGNEDFIANMRDGHHIHYQKDVEFLKQNSEKISSAIV